MYYEASYKNLDLKIRFWCPPYAVQILGKENSLEDRKTGEKSKFSHNILSSASFFIKQSLK